MFDWLLGKKIRVKVPFLVGKAKAKTIDIDGNAHFLELKGEWNRFYSYGGKSGDEAVYVEEIFRDFIEKAKEGMVQVSDTCYLERNQIKSICMVDKEDYYIYEIIEKRRK